MGNGDGGVIALKKGGEGRIDEGFGFGVECGGGCSGLVSWEVEKWLEGDSGVRKRWLYLRRGSRCLDS